MPPVTAVETRKCLRTHNPFISPLFIVIFLRQTKLHIYHLYQIFMTLVLLPENNIDVLIYIIVKIYKVVNFTI